jgi:penicillin-binding protein activator
MFTNHKESASQIRSTFTRCLPLIVTLMGCAPAFEGEYSDPKKVEIVDDRWNETDARKTAETMIKSVLEKDWLGNYRGAHKNEKPIVIVDDIENRTDEHIDTKALTEFIRDELINSGKVRFVNNDKRQKILDEIKYQQSGAVSKKSAKNLGKQFGADFMLGGAISSNVHAMEGLKTITYQTNLTLTNLETAEIEYSDKYLVKKRFNRSGSSW